MQAIAHEGCTDGVKRVCTESWLCRKNPLPHRGIEPASAVRRFNALPAELHHLPREFQRSVHSLCFFPLAACWFTDTVQTLISVSTAWIRPLQIVWFSYSVLCFPYERELNRLFKGVFIFCSGCLAHSYEVKPSSNLSSSKYSRKTLFFFLAFPLTWCGGGGVVCLSMWVL